MPACPEIPINTNDQPLVKRVAVFTPNVGQARGKELHRLSDGEARSYPKIEEADSLDLIVVTPTGIGRNPHRGKEILGEVKPGMSYLEDFNRAQTQALRR